MMSQCQMSYWGQVIKFFPVINCCFWQIFLVVDFKQNEKEEIVSLFSPVFFKANKSNLVC